MIIECFCGKLLVEFCAWSSPAPSIEILWVTGSFKVNWQSAEEVLALEGIFFLVEFPQLSVQSSSTLNIFIVLLTKTYKLQSLDASYERVGVSTVMTVIIADLVNALIGYMILINNTMTLCLCRSQS